MAGLRHGRFKMMVDEVMEILKREGELSLEELAYRFNISPTYARALLKAAAELNPRVRLFRGGVAVLEKVPEAGGEEAAPSEG